MKNTNDLPKQWFAHCFSIQIRPKKELESLILSFGEDMEVLEPASLRTSIKNKLQKMQKLYRRSNCQDTQVSLSRKRPSHLYPYFSIFARSQPEPRNYILY